MESITFQNELSGEANKLLAGRQRQVFDLLSLFQTSKLIGLFGENGSGKSSIIKQGLIPELSNGFLGVAGREWKTITIRPGITPLENLAAGIAQLGLEKGKQKLEDEVLLKESMQLSSEGLRNACIQNFDSNNTCNSLLVIDNFEDLFQFKEVSQNQLAWDITVKSFINNISKCVGNSNLSIYFLVVLRADYMPRLFEHRLFYEIISLAQYNLPQFRKIEFSKIVQAYLAPTQKTIHKDASDLLFNQLGKDLKNLTLVKLFLDEAIDISSKYVGTEITVQIYQQVSLEKLFSKKLDAFFEGCTAAQKKLFEKLLKQITVTPEGGKLRKPIRIDHFLQVTSSSLKELSPFVHRVQQFFPFLLDLVLPYQERMEIKDHSVISEAAVIDIKNEQFIPHWPRLVEWIKEEKESQDLYKRLSEKAKLFEKGLTDYIKPPDLDFAISWYEQQKPDELWSNQFDSNHHRTISYLLTSQIKFQDEILKKEVEQKEKIKKLRKIGAYVIIGSLVILVVIGIFAYDAKRQEILAQIAREEAVRNTEKAKLEKNRADLLYTQAQEAMMEAQTNERMALSEKMRADEEYVRANYLRNEAEVQKAQIQVAFRELDQKRNELNSTVFNLQVSDSLKGVATQQAENARAYQEMLNTILSLRNKIQKKDYLEDEMQNLLDEVQAAYIDYKTKTLAFKAAELPNNDLYQLLLILRTELIENDYLVGLPGNLASVPNGLRKISVSSIGSVAAGGDDGILLYTKQALGPGPVIFSRFNLGKDRIRSLEFITANEVIIGTVSGKIFQFNTITGNNKLLTVGFESNQIIEQLTVTGKGVFGLVGGKIIKIDVNNPSQAPKITTLAAKNVFKLDDDNLLVVGKDNSLLLFDIRTLQWQPINSNLKNTAISAAVSSGENLFLGLENGDVVICRTIKLGNVVSIKSELTIAAHRTRITSLAYDPNTQKLFSASLDQTANIFDLNLKKLRNDYVAIFLNKIEGFDKWIWDFALVPIGKMKILLTVDESGKLKSWQTGPEVLYQEIFDNSNTNKVP